MTSRIADLRIYRKKYLNMVKRKGHRSKVPVYHPSKLHELL